jgi:hypothetical protein
MASSGPEPVPVELTESQRRHLRVLLGQIEAVIAEVVRLTEQEPADRALLIDLADLPADLGPRVRGEVESVRQGIAILASRFALEPERRSRARRAQALLGVAAVDAENAGSRALKAYGPVDPALSEELDPMLDEIGRALRAMASALVEELGGAGPVIG